MAKPRFVPAEVFQPGEYLRDELNARGWTQGDFAKIIGRPLQVVNEIVNGKKRITVETAKAIPLGDPLAISKVLGNLERKFIST